MVHARLQNVEAEDGHRYRHHEVAQGRADAAYSAAAVRRSGRVSAHDRSNETTLLDLLNTRLSRQPRTPGHPSRDCSQTASGAVHCDFTASRTRNRSQNVFGIYCSIAHAIEQRPRG